MCRPVGTTRLHAGSQGSSPSPEMSVLRCRLPPAGSLEHLLPFEKREEDSSPPTVTYRFI